MLRNLLSLPQPSVQSVFSADSDVPAWAQSSVAALNEAGIEIPVTTSATVLTRREAAELLYETWTLQQTRENAAKKLAK